MSGPDRITWRDGDRVLFDRHPPERGEQATCTTQALTVALASVREIEATRW